MGDSLMFVHLHGHTYWSLLDGAAPPEELFRRAASLGMPGIAVTDHGAMYGTAECYLIAKRMTEETGKPFRFIPGVEAYVAPRSRFDKEKSRGDDANWHLVLWALDNVGLSMLYRLVSRSEVYYKPRIDKALLAELVKECGQGHIAGSSACLASETSRLLLEDNYQGARGAALQYGEILGKGNFFLELQDHGLEEQRLVNRGLLRLHRETELPLIVANDYHYVEPEHAFLHDVVVCIQTGKQLSDDNRLQFSSNQAYLKSPAEMLELFPDHKEAFFNTLHIMERCQVELDFDTVHLPHFELPEGYDSADRYLRTLAEEGASRRYGEISQTVRKRLEYELEVIGQMGYSDYFLIVWDFVRFAREKGIPVGPGRGSAAGSLVAYCLQITNIDPLRYGLLFERFLNPARITLPDVDMDFCYHRRNEVIEYVVQKYGADRTAQIITFGTLKARAAVRDVARVLGVPLRKADAIAKAIPFGESLANALATASELQNAYTQDEESKKVLDTARFLEGFPRHASTHAAGVVIAPRPLELDMPLGRPESDKVVTPFVTQYPMGILEEMKFLKVDFLALRNLSVIQATVDWVERLHGIELDMETIPLDDEDTYRNIFHAGLTGGIFQFESEGMRRLLQDFQPESLEHLTLLNAMYRPGPMQYIPTVIRRRKGQEAVTWPHPHLEELLKETYGIMAYQEQVMAVAHHFAGFSLGEADLLRRAMGKKKQSIIDAERQKFIQGAVSRGYSEVLARQIYDDIEKFAGYGFNKSHASAYALIAYQTAYLKNHHPTEFMAALLTSVMGKGKNVKLGEYLAECQDMGITVGLPDINTSEVTFVPHTDKTISFGLSAIKNVGESAALAVVENRDAGPYQSLLDLAIRARPSKDALLSLLRVGALDGLGEPRAKLEAILEQVLQVAASHNRSQHRGQGSLFDMATIDEQVFTWETGPEIAEYDEHKKLQYERELIGVYLSGHPLDQYAHRLGDWGVTTSRELERRSPSENVVVAGVVVDLRRVLTRRNDEMAFVTIEDQAGPIEIIIFPQVYEKYRQLLSGEAILIIEGRNDSSVEEVDDLASDELVAVGEDEGVDREFQAKVIASALSTIDEWQEKMDKEKNPRESKQENSPRPKGPMVIGADGLEEEVLLQLRELLQEFSGNTPVALYFASPSKTCLWLTKEYWIDGARLRDFCVQAEHLVGKGRINRSRS
ncbi:MAG: DNA polymerase III subunit alpha [Firmicutes bacterium]|jgi:DNA polymerase-3 subunit alpha|nr:DNA polymerase III subunit alpha [Bacillota bacterium]